MYPLKPVGRRGFSLVEILVIIAIVVVLMALLLAVIGSVFRYVEDAKVRHEIGELSTAVESFKVRYGRYPVSKIKLHEDGKYLPGDPSAAYLKEVFTGIDLDLYTTSGGKRWHDWNGNGVADPPYTLEADECLVFFLGGVPQRDPASGLIGMTGFCADKSQPTSPQGREGPLFPFQTERLAWPFAGRFPRNDFPDYLDPFGTPYLYFANPVVLRPTSFPSSHDHDSYILAITFQPYYKTREITGAGIITHYAGGDDGYQIISAGRDQAFGVGGIWPLQNYPAQAFDRDNFTNFAESQLDKGR